ncbi:uncharacterized protein LOC127797855 [Diospyros lotus]|uniref:uncharacterized protein LOC127797855 n=1 Tax=Diospyros lotus TaxID=55363 RepID=UPI002258BC67|nr:uncharacterized protein LOC127797855 [Diospyros lotus]
MDEYRQSFSRPGAERRLDQIVSGKSFSAANQIQMCATNRPRSPDLHALPAPATKPWGFNDPEMKRRRRIARYKVYSVEGRVKACVRKGLRWIKNKCSEIVHGF